MNKAMNFILRLSSWQAFLLLMSPFFISVLLGFFVSFEQLLSYEIILVMLSYIILLAWVCAMALFLNKKESVASSSLRYFKFNAIFLMVYVMVICVFILTDNNLSGLDTTQQYPYILIPLHLYSIFAFIYIYVTAAKLFVNADRESHKGFTSYLGMFVLLCFFPLGVWWIQPKLNRMIQNR